MSVQSLSNPCKANTDSIYLHIQCSPQLCHNWSFINKKVKYFTVQGLMEKAKSRMTQ